LFISIGDTKKTFTVALFDYWKHTNLLSNLIAKKLQCFCPSNILFSE
jgi:hypothetical protein